ncbi:transposase family protein [Streptomyces sp. YC419]|uniref:Transposase family protein n=1 Tax=Streptomyces ureilyticus TaxID=1775131 RepID=A0ABX0E0T4_9ACTN|nr:transposase family protein [Streptomyces ureilyticus]
MQLVTDPAGRLLWISPALPGRATTSPRPAPTGSSGSANARASRSPVLADRAYMGAGPWVTTSLRRPPGRDLTPTQQTVNRALSAARAQVERGVARLKSWRIFRKARCSPNRPAPVPGPPRTSPPGTPGSGRPWSGHPDRAGRSAPSGRCAPRAGRRRWPCPAAARPGSTTGTARPPRHRRSAGWWRGLLWIAW